MKNIKRKLLEIPYELFNQVEMTALKNERSVNKQIIFMIKESMNKKK